MKWCKALTVAVGIVLIFWFWYAVGSSIDTYVRGKYGHKCYPEESIHGNIKYQIEYSSLESCLESLK